MKDENESSPIIGNALPVQLGFALAVILAIVGGVWWAGNWTGAIQAKLDVLIGNQASMMQTVKTSAEELRDLTLRVGKLESVGSPGLQRVQDQISILSRELEIHRATSEPPKKHE